MIDTKKSEAMESGLVPLPGEDDAIRAGCRCRKSDITARATLLYLVNGECEMHGFTAWEVNAEVERRLAKRGASREGES